MQHKTQTQNSNLICVSFCCSQAFDPVTAHWQKQTNTAQATHTSKTQILHMQETAQETRSSSSALQLLQSLADHKRPGDSVERNEMQQWQHQARYIYTENYFVYKGGV